MNITFDTSSLQPDTSQLKKSGAAKDFEALMIGQMLKSMREEDSGWLGTGEDQSSAAAFGLGEEELAKSIAQGGGFGLAKVIQNNLP
jgi:Rod binding domain-containing protein